MATKRKKTPSNRPRKKQKRRVPLCSTRPSQSSIDVPVKVKSEVKAGQGNRCWLCGEKFHKTHRPGEIAHVMPQSMTQREYFEENHQMGRIQISNIHDSANLLALCSICHFAFDAKQWTFLPDDLRKWVDMLKSDPESDHIRNWNSKRDVTFRRWRLVGAADWESSKDDAYLAAFTKEPLKVWNGEVGTNILRNVTTVLATPKPDGALKEAIKDFRQLSSMWMDYEVPCSDPGCALCTAEAAKTADDHSDDDHSDDDGNGDGGSKSRKTPPDAPKSPKPSKPSKPSQPFTRRYQTRQSNLYDKSVPYSYREGYTWANTTANELMARWQGLPYVKLPGGQIKITQGYRP